MGKGNVTQASLAPPLAGERDGRFYSPQLDALRFFAALLVLHDHSPTLPWAPLAALQPYGWVGIDLFLCLSAFLIARLLLLEHERTGGISIRSFYIRRALRIWPLYFGYATAVSLWVLFRGKIAAATVLAWWLSHVSFSNNLLTAVKGWTPIPWSLQLWTISLEEQAYFLLPLVLFAVVMLRPSTRTVICVAVAVVVVLILARLACFLVGQPTNFFYVLPIRGDAFVFGTLAAILLSRNVIQPRAWMFPLGMVVMAMLVLFSPLEKHTWYDVFGYTVTALGATAVVFGSQAAIYDNSPLTWQPLRYLGKISYGIYVFHILAIDVAQKLQQKIQLSNSWTWLLGFALTIAISAASYHLYERHFLKLKRRFEMVPSRPA